MAISAINSTMAAQLSAMQTLHSAQRAGMPRVENDKSTQLREHFTQFVGEAFFGQMLKAMRATVGKPAYFHGGRAEEVFQGQLDQHLAEHLTATSATKLAEPMFNRQFPHLAEKRNASDLNQLAQLRRN
jgi:Rod binding domain-containing protein